MSILILDNYDSFTYNLVHMVRELTGDENMEVFRNDEISVAEAGRYDKILLSPGPGLPSENGIMPKLIQTYAKDKAILGVCLGHQAIAEAFGGRLYNLPTVLHGIVTAIHLKSKDDLFAGLPDTFKVCRYHSWAIDPQEPGEMEVTAVDDQHEIMAITHKKYALKGVQFHPESILTEHGIQLIDNWLQS